MLSSSSSIPAVKLVSMIRGKLSTSRSVTTVPSSVGTKRPEVSFSQ